MPGSERYHTKVLGPSYLSGYRPTGCGPNVDNPGGIAALLHASACATCGRFVAPIDTNRMPIASAIRPQFAAAAARRFRLFRPRDGSDITG